MAKARTLSGVVTITAVFVAAALLPASAASTVPVASSTSASAPTLSAPPEVVVWLTSGGLVRGQVIEHDPATRLVLQTVTEKVIVVEANQIAKIVWLDGTSNKSIAPSAAPSASTQGKTREEASRVRIFTENTGLWLESRGRNDESAPWRRSAALPCNTEVGVDDKEFRVHGEGWRASRVFHLKAGMTTLRASGGSERAHDWGAIALIGGLGMAMTGALLYGVGRLEDERAMVWSGVSAMMLGGTGIVVSIPLLASARTSVKNEDGTRVALTSSWRF